MDTSKALLVSYTILQIVQLGETRREISVSLEPLPKKKELYSLGFVGYVSFSRASVSSWNGKLIISVPPKKQQPTSTGTIEQAEVAAAKGTENKTGVGGVKGFFGKLIPSNDDAKENKLHKEMKQLKKDYLSLRGKYTIYITALPGVVSGVTTRYPVLYDEKWSIDDSCKQITIPFKDFTIPEWDNLELALESRSYRGILELASNRLYIYPQFGVPLPAVIAALERAYNRISEEEKNFQESFPPLFVTKIENGEDKFYDVRCDSKENTNYQDQEMVNAEGQVLVVDVKIMESYYNTKLNFYHVKMDGQTFVASRDKWGTRPLSLKKILAPVSAHLEDLTDDEFDGPKVGLVSGHWKNRWGPGQSPKWKPYNFATELFLRDKLPKQYNLRQILEPKKPITVTKKREDKSAERLGDDPWVRAKVTFTATKFTFLTTTGSKTTFTYSSQNTGWIKKKEGGGGELDKEYIAGKSAKDWDKVTEVKGNVAVEVDKEILKVHGVLPEEITVTPKHNDETAFMFSFTGLSEIQKSYQPTIQKTKETT